MLSFINAAKYPFKGISYLFSHKNLFRYIFIPFILDLTLASILLFLVFFQIPEVVDWIKSAVIDWFGIEKVGVEHFIVVRTLKWILGVAGAFIWFILGVVILFIFPLVLTILSAIIDPLFRSILHSKTKEMEGFPEKRIPVIESLYLSLKSVINEIKKLVFYLLFSVILLFINIVPVIGSLLYPILQFFLTALFITWEFLTPYLDEKKLSFLKQLRFVFQNKKLFLGFGIPAVLLLLIPFVQVIFLSTHVIGGALLSITFENKK